MLSPRRRPIALVVLVSSVVALGIVATARPGVAITLLTDTRYVTDVYYIRTPCCSYAGDTVTVQEIYGEDFAPSIQLATGAPGRTAMTLDNILSVSASGLEISGSAGAWTGQDIAWGSSILRIDFFLDVASTYALTSALSVGYQVGGGATRPATATLRFDHQYMDEWGVTQTVQVQGGQVTVYRDHGPAAQSLDVSGSGTLAPGQYQLRMDASASDLGASLIDFQLDITPIPEPATATLIGLGLAVLARAGGRARHAKQRALQECVSRRAGS